MDWESLVSTREGMKLGQKRKRLQFMGKAAIYMLVPYKRSITPNNEYDHYRITK